MIFFHKSDLEFRLCKLIFKRTNVSSIKFLVQIEKKAYLACPNKKTCFIFVIEIN